MIRSVSARPCSLRIVFSLWIRSRTRPSSRSSRIERRVERDRDRVVLGQRPALAARGARRAPRPARASRPSTRKRPPSSSSNSPASSAARTARSSLPSFGPEHREVRLHAHLGRLDRAEHDLLHAQLVRDLVRVRRDRARSALRRRAGAAAGAASGPPAPRAWRPSSTMRRTAAISGEQRLVRLARLGPAGEEDRLRRALGRVRDEVPPEVLGEERHHRRDHAQRLRRARTRACGTPPRRRTRSAAASGGCTSSRGRRRTPRRRRSRWKVRYAS